MANVERITLSAVKQAEVVHDMFEEAIADGRLSPCELATLRTELDLTVMTTSLADSALKVCVSAARGVIDTRYSRDLVKDFRRLEVQVMEVQVNDPDFPDAA